MDLQLEYNINAYKNTISSYIVLLIIIVIIIIIINQQRSNVQKVKSSATFENQSEIGRPFAPTARIISLVASAFEIQPGSFSKNARARTHTHPHTK